MKKNEIDKIELNLFELFDKYLENYHYSDISKYNVTNIVSHFKDYFKNNNKLISNITEDDIQKYVNYEYCFGKIKYSTVYTRYQRLKAIFNYAVRKKYITQNPCNNVNVKKIRHIRRQLNCNKIFIKKIYKIFRNTKLYPIVFIALHTGLRREELLALTKEDFEYQHFLFLKIPVLITVRHALIYNPVLKVQTIKATKTKQIRRIDLDFKCSIFLYFYMKRLKTDRLFNAVPNVLSKEFHKTLKKANLSKKDQIRFHDLRHIHFSYLILNMKNQAFAIKLVQERAGHSSIVQTYNTYAHLLKDSQKSAIKCFNFI